MNKERLKTLTLSILVIMSMILIQQLWFPSLVNTLRVGARADTNSHMTLVEQRKALIGPKKVTVSFGAGDRRKNYYTILSSNTGLVWDQCKNIIKDYFLGDPQVKQIERDDYIQVNTLKSVELEFGNNMSTILISSIFDSLDNKITGNIKEIKKILIPAFNRGTIYIAESQDKIYEIKLSNYKEDPTLVSFINQIENAEHIKYHPIYSLFEELDENYTVMPINYNLTAQQIFVESEIDIDNEAMLMERTKGFFNENFDFVKTIKETSGARVYIYGYGEKSVRINNRGALEYNEEVGNISSTNILTSLDAAISFIHDNGGLPDNAYLKHVQTIDNGQNKGYKFSFGYRMGGLPVELNSNRIEDPIEIEVYGNRVKTYRSLVRQAMDRQGVSPYQKVLYLPSIIENNINYLKLPGPNKGNQLMEEMGKEEKILHILKDIKDVQLVYLDSAEEGKRQLLKPSWMITVKNDVYYFDGYTGELINSLVLN